MSCLTRMADQRLQKIVALKTVVSQSCSFEKTSVHFNSFYLSLNFFYTYLIESIMRNFIFVIALWALLLLKKKVLQKFAKIAFSTKR
jgi:hypothetical protein